MATSKTANGGVVDDLASDLTETAPPPRKSPGRKSASFVPNPALVERITASFSKDMAVVIGKPFQTAGDPETVAADKRRRIAYEHNAELVADTLGKSVRFDKVIDEATPDHFTLRMVPTAKRERKAKDAAAEAPAQ